jgi:hypothetical protein
MANYRPGRLFAYFASKWTVIHACDNLPVLPDKLTETLQPEADRLAGNTLRRG